ncbi:MAG: hypothetical protein ACYDAN_11030, partial [Candidatus Limnocylindrales bacterium]
MTNERFDPEVDGELGPEFERDLRATLDDLMSRPAPATLRARVERTLATGRDGTRPQRRLRLGWLIGALVAAVLVVAPLAMSLANRQPGVVGQATPSVAPVGSPTPSADASSSPDVGSPAASPTGPTSDQIGLPVVNVSADVVRKTRVDSTQTGARDGGPLTGPYLYQWPVSGTGASSITDLGGGSVRIIDPVSLPVGRDEAIAAFAHDSSWMAMVVTPSNLNDCRSHATIPMPWRIQVAPMGPDGLPAGAWREIASGTEQSTFSPFAEAATMPDCAYAYPPVISLHDDLLAWSSSSGPALDAGSNVAVVSLATTGTVSFYRTATRVVELDVSEQAVAWVESTNLLIPSGPHTWKVMEARLPDETPSPVDIGVSPTDTFVPQMALDGTAITAQYQDALAKETIVRVDGGRTETLSPDGGPASCGRIVAADRGRVVLTCFIPWTQPDGTDSSWALLAVWTAADGLRVVAVDGRVPSLPPGVSSTGDWITWYAIDFAASTASGNDQGTVFGDQMAIPIDALAAPQAPTEVKPTPAASLPPYVSMPVVSVSGLLPPTTLIPDPWSSHEGGPPQGPFVETGYTRTGIEVADATGASVRVITPPLLSGEAIDSFVSSAGWLAIVTSKPGRTCGIGPDPTHIAWRVLAVALGGDGTPTGA